MSWSFARRSLAAEFMLTGAVVALLAMLLVGLVVTRLLEASVTRNAASATALYVDSVIAPILPDMRRNEVLDPTIRRALDETLTQGALRDRLLSFLLWRKDGTILYATDPAMIGKRFAPNPQLRQAFEGRIVAEFEQADDAESAEIRATNLPVLEIYNPVLQPWSGEVVAVSEFYEVAAGLRSDLRQARLASWAAVAGVISVFFMALSAIVLRGSRTIEAQKGKLAQQVEELSTLLSQNKALRARVERAAQRTTALNEHHLRRVGADLHDGPAQLLALASLSLENPALVDSSVTSERRAQELAAIASNLSEAMREIRMICNGLVLPQIETAGVAEIVMLAARAHEDRTGTWVETSLEDGPVELQTAEKICVYRFVQEALNNAYKHAGGAGQAVVQFLDGNALVVEVSDRGPGFDLGAVPVGRIGLSGLRERIESLGGGFSMSASAAGTTLKLRVELNRTDQDQ